ncbi:MAG: PepSY domain-containing protein [Gemmatimonadetes bacterium]|nr:PepSY domain-containing protein [Gemmatimonadota bacterium]
MYKTRHLLVATVVAVGSFAFATTSGAQQTKHVTHATKTTTTVHVKGDAKLKAEAKVSESDAIATAEKEVPDGKIQSAELEREGGKLIYSFDVKAPHKSGVEEVNVDATTGTVVKKEHESAKQEKAEMKQEAKAAKAEAKKEAKEMKTTKP